MSTTSPQPQQQPPDPTPDPTPTITKPPPTTPKSIPKPPTIRNRPHHRIKTHPTLTPHRRRVYYTILSIPPGRWTTYAALATHLNSSARAVGTALRNNPFAPEVPCHRVLGAGGKLGGYMGETGEGGGKVRLKREILEGEGVRFVEDGGKGIRAQGGCFVNFEE